MFHTVPVRTFPSNRTPLVFVGHNMVLWLLLRSCTGNLGKEKSADFEEKYGVISIIHCKERYEWTRDRHLPSGDGKKRPGSQVNFMREEDKAESRRKQISSACSLAGWFSPRDPLIPAGWGECGLLGEVTSTQACITICGRLVSAVPTRRSAMVCYDIAKYNWKNESDFDSSLLS